MGEMGLEGLLHLRGKTRVDPVLEQTNATVVMVRFLLRSVHVHVITEAHIVL